MTAAPESPPPAPKRSSSRRCANCGADLTTPWCGQCGQRARAGRLDFAELGAEAWSAVVNLDSGVWRLVRGLFHRPGAVYAHYLAGARKRYFNPILFLLLAEGAYIALGSLALERHFELVGRSPQTAAEAVTLQGDKFRALLALPALTLLGWLASRPRYTAAEVGAFWCFALGALVLIGALFQPLMLFWPQQRDALKYAAGVCGSLAILWHVASFFGAPNARGVARAVALTALSLVLLNYAARAIYTWNDFEVDWGLAATLRDTFGL